LFQAGVDFHLFQRRCPIDTPKKIENSTFFPGKLSSYLAADESQAKQTKVGQLLTFIVTMKVRYSDDPIPECGHGALPTLGRISVWWNRSFSFPLTPADAGAQALLHHGRKS
jgi:hypothetical protein